MALLLVANRKRITVEPNCLRPCFVRNAFVFASTLSKQRRPRALEDFRVGGAIEYGGMPSPHGRDICFDTPRDRELVTILSKVMG